MKNEVSTLDVVVNIVVIVVAVVIAVVVAVVLAAVFIVAVVVSGSLNLAFITAGGIKNQTKMKDAMSTVLLLFC